MSLGFPEAGVGGEPTHKDGHTEVSLRRRVPFSAFGIWGNRGTFT